MNKYLILLASLLLVAGLTASAQGNFSAQANALKQQYEKKQAVTRANGEDMPRAAFVVICKTDASPVAVGEQLKALGAEVSNIYGRCVAVTIPADKIEAMAQTEGVLLVDVAVKGKKKTDTTRKVTQVDEVQTGKGEKLPQAYTGKDVVIGLIDTGFDFTHPGFKDKDGNLRIKAAYLTGNTEVPQEKVTGINSPGIVTDPKVILDTLKVKDTAHTHGTHCAFLASGTPIEGINGLTGNMLGGMAPDAELILCTDQSTPTVNIDNGMSDNLAFMKHYAEKNNKELVISLSMNSHEGWHNGTSPAAQLIGEYAKNHPFMLSAGNEGNDSMCIHRTVKVGDSINVAAGGDKIEHIYYLKSQKPIEARIGLYDLRLNMELSSFSVKLNTGEKADNTISISTDSDEWKKISKYFEGSITLSSSQGTAMESNTSDKTFPYTLIHLQCIGSFARFEGEIIYGLTLHIKPLEEPAEVFGWTDYNAELIKDDIYEKGTSDCSMGDWGTSGVPVSVGAWAANNMIKTIDGKTETNDYGKVVGDIAPFSSYGTDLAGHKHPDICAPGVSGYSAINSFNFAGYPVVAQKDFNNQFEGQKSARTYSWGSGDGTSMAAPVSAGIVALWSQAARDKGKKLTSADIKDICAKTCDNDEFTKAKPERFGSGKINAYKGLLYVLDLYDPTGINGISTNQPKDITFRVAGDCLYAEGAEDGTPATLYNLQGVIVAKTTVKSGMISLAGLQKGVYAVQLGKLGSTLIRL